MNYNNVTAYILLILLIIFDLVNEMSSFYFQGHPI